MAGPRILGFCAVPSPTSPPALPVPLQPVRRPLLSSICCPQPDPPLPAASHHRFRPPALPQAICLLTSPGLARLGSLSSLPELPTPLSLGPRPSLSPSTHLCVLVLSALFKWWQEWGQLLLASESTQPSYAVCWPASPGPSLGLSFLPSEAGLVGTEPAASCTSSEETGAQRRVGWGREWKSSQEPGLTPAVQPWAILIFLCASISSSAKWV